MYLRQSTTQTIRFGPSLDKTNGVTEETGLTLAQADMRISKDGGAFAQKSASGNATHDSDGWYSTDLSTTDTNTVGELIINIHQPANMLPIWQRYWVLEEAIYDAMFGASAAGFDSSGRIDVGSWIGTAVTLSTGSKPDVNVNEWADVLLATTNPLPNAASDEAGGLPVSDTGNLDMDAMNTAAVRLTAVRAAVLTDWINGQRLDLLLDAIQTDLDNSTDGLGALKTLIDTVNTDLSNSTDGLSALKTLIDTVNTDLSNSTDGLSALKTLIDTVNTDLSNSTDGLSALKTLLDAIPTTAMRGTENAATAADLLDKLGAVNESAAAGDPSSTESVMQYVKQIVNVLTGSDGIVTIKAAAAPASGVSLAEMIRAIYDDTNSLDGTKIPDTLSLNNINAEVDTAFTTQMADSVPSDGTISTREQALYAILQVLTEFSISGTVLTVKKVDGSTSLMTLDLSPDGTSPTGLTRAT